jgi:L-fucose isomerase-like protein
MMQPLHIAFVPLARPTFDIAYATEMTEAALAQLKAPGVNLDGGAELVQDAAGVERVAAVLADLSPDLLVIFQATFADSSMARALVEAVDAPVLLWAVPEPHTGGRLRLNSLCGINLAGHTFTRLGYKYDYLYAPPGDPAALEKVLSLASAGRARRLLKRARLGRVGENPDGFETCLFDADALRQRFGVDVVQFDLQGDVFERARAVPPAETQAVADALAGQVQNLDEMDPGATQGTLSAYVALRQLAERDGVNGFAVRCWPEFFTEMGCAACGAMSMLSDEMTPCSCETDVNGTLTQMMMQWVSGEPAFGTDMVSIDGERDAVVLWHCGLAPLSMADPEAERRVTIHSNRKLPLLMEFPLKPGRVTVGRLSEASGVYRLVVGAGEVVRAPQSFSGTSGLLRFDRPAEAVFDVVLREGLEHHISITYGDHTAALLALADMLDLPILQLTE